MFPQNVESFCLYLGFTQYSGCSPCRQSTSPHIHRIWKYERTDLHWTSAHIFTVYQGKVGGEGEYMRAVSHHRRNLPRRDGGTRISNEAEGGKKKKEG